MSKSGLLSVRTSAAANAGKKRGKSESKSRSRYDDEIFGHLRLLTRQNGQNSTEELTGLICKQIVSFVRTTCTTF